MEELTSIKNEIPIDTIEYHQYVYDEYKKYRQLKGDKQEELNQAILRRYEFFRQYYTTEEGARVVDGRRFRETNNPVVQRIPEDVKREFEEPIRKLETEYNELDRLQAHYYLKWLYCSCTLCDTEDRRFRQQY
jgi:hypothetical protein